MEKSWDVGEYHALHVHLNIGITITYTLRIPQLGISALISLESGPKNKTYRAQFSISGSVWSVLLNCVLCQRLSDKIDVGLVF